MRSKFLIIISVLLSVSNSPLFAQNPMEMRRNDTRSMRKRNATAWSDRPENEHIWAVTGGVGTAGLAIEGKKVISDRMNLRFGGNIFTFKTTRVFTVDAGRSRASGTASIGFNNLHVFAEGKVTPKFRFVGGLAVFYRSDIYIYGKMLDGIVSNGKNLTAEEAGALTIGVEWKQFAPYLGIGLFRDMPLGKFNANLDLGTYYIGKPTTKWLASGPDAQAKIEEYEKQAEDVLAAFQWYPVLQLNINYVVK
ncbi:MAG: hypothetical protein EOP56_12590 [Sphingobacteriales bacterium]|nr:MAG: hypothetical protein EOP56_12590 [Sphingobacteriales bacterium]